MWLLFIRGRAILYGHACISLTILTKKGVPRGDWINYFDDRMFISLSNCTFALQKTARMATVHLLLGGNRGDRQHFLTRATGFVERKVGKVCQRSSIYESEPWGFDAPTPFLNQVIRVETVLTPLELLDEIKNIEKQLGRVKLSAGYESRVIDIDILVYDDLRMSEKELQIPHPRMHLRKFTLVPMAEISGGLKHPLLQVDMATLNKDCRDESGVKLYAAG